MFCPRTSCADKILCAKNELSNLVYADLFRCRYRPLLVMSSETLRKQVLDKDRLLSLTSCKDLCEVEELNLSNLGLCETDLIPDVFNCLTSLVEINLSGNRLSCIPDEIKLPKLQYLDMSKNCIKNITWIERFDKLIDLDIENNLSLTIDDNYKVVFLLKRLQFFNRKRIDNREKFGTQYTKGLLVQMEKLWNSMNLEQRLLKMREEQCLEEFLCKANEKVRHGPNSLKEFRRWRIKRLGQEFVDFKLKCPEQSFLDTFKDIKVTTKHKADITSDSPSCKIRKLSKSGSNTNLDYSVGFALQCHSNDKGPQDFVTQIWCCEFEPNKNEASKTTNIVATCGGETVCLIDCETGKVQSKFHQPNEEFFTLSWTTLLLGKKLSNILAAAGCLGFIHLIHPDQDICYGRIKIHSAPIQSLIFAPTGKTHLLSADRKCKIFLLDIDVPTTPEHKFSWKKLIAFEGVEETPLKLLVPDSGNSLLCATEHGLYCWATNGFTKNINKTVTSVCEITFPFVSSDVRIVDAISCLSQDWIVTKCAQQGVLFLWNFAALKSEILKAVQSKNGKVAAKITSELKWSNAKQCYINLDCCKKHKYVVSGDDKGNLWLYAAGDLLQRNKSSKCPVPEMVENPRNVIAFPMFTARSGRIQDIRNGTIYNDVCISHDSKYIVTTADCNLVVIYHKN